jgi:predicted protein tyrosine phosphatase
VISEQKFLFVCSRNQWRSRTAETIFSGIPGYSVRSVGTAEKARIKVTEGHIGWADLIFVMENRHAERLRIKFPEAISGKPVICHLPPRRG